MSNEVKNALKSMTKSSTLLAEKINEGGAYDENGNVRFVETEPVYLQYDERSLATLRQEAKDYVDEMYKSVSEKEGVKADKKLSSLQKKKDQAKLNHEVDYAKRRGEYREDKTDMTDDFVRNGTLISSIYRDGMQELGEGYRADIDFLNREYEIIAGYIDREMNLVLEEKKVALMDYDLKKAAEVEKKYAELRKERNEYNAKVNEYNATLRRLKENEEIYKKQAEEAYKKFYPPNEE